MKNNLLMPFIGENDNPLYVRGFEIGQLWEMIKNKEEIKSRPFHSENIDQVHLMCDYYEVSYDIIPDDETWSFLTIRSNESNN